MSTQHTPGPWKALPDPIHAGKHACHDSRWIATADSQIEFGHDPRSWTLTSGTLICEMRDHIDAPNANAALVAAAPDLLAALKDTAGALLAAADLVAKQKRIYTQNGEDTCAQHCGWTENRLRERIAWNHSLILKATSAATVQR